MNQTEFPCVAVRFSETADDQEIGHVFLYLLKNDHHTDPYGLIEDLFVEETHRNKGIGKKLITVAIAEARVRGCYKLLSTSRYSRPEVHAWYERLGFTDWGKEFRMNLR